MEKDTVEKMKGLPDGNGREDAAARPSEMFEVKRERSRRIQERPDRMRQPKMEDVKSLNGEEAAIREEKRMRAREAAAREETRMRAREAAAREEKQMRAREPRHSEAGSKERFGGQIRSKEQENQLKLRVLWPVLGVLTVLLIVALIYEIALGNGTKQTGAERMMESNNRPAVTREMEQEAQNGYQ